MSFFWEGCGGEREREERKCEGEIEWVVEGGKLLSFFGPTGAPFYNGSPPSK